MNSFRILPRASLTLLLLGLGFAAVSTGAMAQESEPAVDNAASAIEAIETEPEQSSGTAEGTDDQKKLQKKIDAFQQENAMQKQEIASQKQEIEQIKSRLDDMEDEQQLADLDSGGAEEYSAAKPISVRGFFDLTFSKVVSNSDETLYPIYTLPYSSFTISNLNFYFISQMTETLSALAELRFSFYPHGKESEFETVATINGQENVEGEYVREDTTVRDPSTTLYYKLGSISIERVHLTYSPADWFNVIAGRYLTPFGIWNIEHGSPVILAVRAPFALVRELIPLAQTGVQIYGRFFPFNYTKLDYAITLSNGRGPMDQIMDLDEDKGMGLRLRLQYQRNDVHLALGGYGYTGEYTDIKKIVRMDFNPDLTLNEDADPPAYADLETTEHYREYSAAADLLVEVFGVRLQAEYIWRYRDYLSPTIRSEWITMFLGVSATDTVYEATMVGHDVYTLLAWDLPFLKRFSSVSLTPYIMYEYSGSEDTDAGSLFHMIVGGLNFKPSPFVTLKAEAFHMMPKLKTKYGGNATMMSLQMAVSF